MTMTHTSAVQAQMTPDTALQLLKDGNRRFQENSRANRDFRQQVEATSEGQWPYAVVLSCIDSRAPAELLFDLGIGDVFNARVAGNFINRDILGSMEFACRVAGAKLVIVMGHTQCGAIKGACDNVQLGNLTRMLGKIRPVVESVPEPADAAERTSSNPEFVQSVADRNVELALEAIREHSSVLREMSEAGEIRILGAMYDVQSGEVRFRE
jgi:carbonic anhydrase